jgi:hypothetical protein
VDTETPFDDAVAPLYERRPRNDAGHRPALQKIAVPSRVGEGSLRDDELALTAGWGHAGKGGITMPGKGKLIEREYTEAERAAIAAGAALYERRDSPGGAAESGGAISPVIDRRYSMGDRTCDVYLNDVAYWSNIPVRVWDYTIGGYQVIKKWLSYREEKLLGRALSKEEVRYVQEMARRIGAILLLEPPLDENYRCVKQHSYTWTT